LDRMRSIHSQGSLRLSPSGILSFSRDNSVDDNTGASNNGFLHRIRVSSSFSSRERFGSYPKNLDSMATATTSIDGRTPKHGGSSNASAAELSRNSSKKELGPVANNHINHQNVSVIQLEDDVSGYSDKMAPRARGSMASEDDITFSF
jgi:hypothetical protein